MADALERLRRPDKHYLGAGDGIVFDPPHPIWLDRPGFWDGGRVFLYTLEPIFTVTFVDAAGRERRLRATGRDWTPAELVVTYEAYGLELEERRVVLAGGRFASEWSVTPTTAEPEPLSAVAWTAQEGEDVADRETIRGGANAVEFARLCGDAQLGDGELDVRCTLRFADGPADGWAVYESQQSRSYRNAPSWEASPFRDGWSDGSLPGEARVASSPPRGRTLIYAGLARRLGLEAGRTTSFTVALQAQPALPALRLASAPAITGGPAAEESRAAWRGHFDAAPSLDCTDPFLERYFAYRWYGLRLNFIEPAGNYRHPTCAEGPEFFHCPIAYSAWCHMRELRWLPDPSRARGALLTFLEQQAPDGALPGRVHLDRMHRTDFYFADWGAGVVAVDEVHPDRGFLEAAYEPLGRYAAWMARTRDRDATGLYDVLDPYETGQENMRRYTAVDPDADDHHFDHRLRFKGVDVSVYMYRLHRALARVAAGLGRSADRRAHDAAAERVGQAVASHMWDPDEGMFFDVLPDGMRRTGVKAAICFYPYMTDLVGAEHLEGLRRHLLDPGEFWLPYPVPSTAADDATFDPNAEWRGVRRNCAWNGRVWPMTNSHVAEALGHVATTLDPAWRQRLVEFLRSYVRMLFVDGDPARPSSYEHYSPLTGRPAVYRGLDDYQHSWINDLIVRYVAGFRPTAGGFLADPFPFGLERLRLERLPFRGSSVSITIEGDRFDVDVDGRRAAEGAIGEAVEVTR